MINVDSSNYNEAKQKNFFLNNGTTIKWWQGVGSFLDYTHPQALEWWHKQMVDNVLSLGIDGWKTDGIDPFCKKIKIKKSVLVIT
jgi:alpha-glucosidase (family GH31 glycosyl hydrolase)